MHRSLCQIVLLHSSTTSGSAPAPACFKIPRASSVRWKRISSSLLTAMGKLSFPTIRFRPPSSSSGFTPAKERKLMISGMQPLRRHMARN